MKVEGLNVEMFAFFQMKVEDLVVQILTFLQMKMEDLVVQILAFLQMKVEDLHVEIFAFLQMFVFFKICKVAFLQMWTTSSWWRRRCRGRLQSRGARRSWDETSAPVRKSNVML